MRIALVSPPFVSDYMRNARCDFVSLSNSNWYPIWLAQAGAYLESVCHKTRLLDAQVSKMSKSETLDAIKAFEADMVVVYTGRLSEDSDVCFGDEIAKTGRCVVFVGPYCSISPESLLEKALYAKYAIKGEFELPLAELADGHDVRLIKNLYVKDYDKSEILMNAERALYNTEILDTFPITSKYLKEQIDITIYKTPSELHPFIDVMSGRGCPWGKCTFCLWVHTFIPGVVYNVRSIDHFIAEFDYINKCLPSVKSVMIQDDMLTNRRALEISEALLKRKYKIAWSCYAKPNSKFNQETLYIMKRSGCLNLHVGFESGDNSILKAIEKGSTVDDAIKFAEQVHKAKIHLHGDFAMGHFGDTLESMKKTLDLAKKINPHTAQFQIMIPFKETRFWDQLEEAKAFNHQYEPSYEGMGGASSEEIRAFAKKSYRSFYFSRNYLLKMLKDPRNYFFNRIDQYCKAVPAVTWKKWKI